MKKLLVSLSVLIALSPPALALDFSQPYYSLKGGYSSAFSDILEDETDGEAVSVAVGFENYGTRVELSLTSRKHDDGMDIIPDPIEIDTQSLMLNAYLDLPRFSGRYLILGVGYTEVNIDTLDQSRRPYKEDTAAFGYSFGLGTSIAIGKNTFLDIEWLNSGTYDLDYDIYTVSDNELEDILFSEIYFGIRWYPFNE